MTSENEFRWEITTEEGKATLQKQFAIGAKAALIMAVGYLGVECIKGNVALASLPWMIGIPGVPILLIFLYVVFSKPPKRAYLMNERGIRVMKGRKFDAFRWDEFRYFSTNASEGNIIESAGVDAQRLIGRMYYLRFDDGPIRKTFLIVYSEPGNDSKVYEFLSRHLSYEKWTAGDEMGLITYLFK